MTENIKGDDPRLYQRRSVVWHTSDEDCGPDVGISVGTGDGMIYAGEFPGSVRWGLCIYPLQGDKIIISKDVDEDQARNFIEWLGFNLKEVVE